MHSNVILFLKKNKNEISLYPGIELKNKQQFLHYDQINAKFLE